MSSADDVFYFLPLDVLSPRGRRIASLPHHKSMTGGTLRLRLQPTYIRYGAKTLRTSRGHFSCPGVRAKQTPFLPGEAATRGEVRSRTCSNRPGPDRPWQAGLRERMDKETILRIKRAARGTRLACR